MKIGILFSGQGSQYPGMGSSLYENYEPAKVIFDKAGDEITNQCFHGTKEELRLTQITQPSIFTVSMAAYESFLSQLRENGLHTEISAMAGFSMGEYSAMTASGMIEDFSITLELLKKRGKFMTEAGLDENGQPKGAMAAAFGKREKIKEAVEALREGDILECVNFNSPIQTAVAGDRAAIERFHERARSEFGVKVKLLSVSSAFHSGMMEPASEALKARLTNTHFSQPKVKVYSNVSGRDIMEGKPEGTSVSQWISRALTLQVKSPVYWQETIENMKDDGIDVFIEVGPGKTLSSLVSKTVKGTKELHVEDKESMEKTISEISEISTVDSKPKPDKPTLGNLSI